MIRIGKPLLEKKGDKVFLKATIEDEYQMIKEEIYYSTSFEYSKYLCDEVADAFVVGMLLPAARYHQDIVVEGAISEKLYYNLNNSILYLLSLIWGEKRVYVKANQFKPVKFNTSAVGCGCSLGVDSFATMLQHLDEACPKDYQITHLTYFNVGAMGYVNLNKAKESFQKDLQKVLVFAEQVKKPVVCLESNFSLMYSEFDFDQSGDIRNFSAALALQKLFGKYLYGSSYPIKDFRFEKSQTGYYETLLAPLLSTESCELVIANPDMSRIDKTKYIVNNPYVQKTLYVCWKELLANKHPNSEIAKIKDIYLNCTRCDKCLRTLLAIDMLGKLEDFSKIFDLKYYRRVKDSYVAKVVYGRRNNAFYQDLYEMMRDTNFNVSFRTKLILILYKIKFIGVYHRLKDLLKGQS